MNYASSVRAFVFTAMPMWLCVTANSASAAHTAIALTGSSIEGTAFRMNELVGTPVINESGVVAFPCTYQGTQTRGVVRFTGVVLRQSLASGGTLPGVAMGGSIDSMYQLSLADNGRIAMRALVVPTGDDAIVTGLGTNFQAVVQANTNFPTIAEEFQRIRVQPCMDSSGRVVFAGDVYGPNWRAGDIWRSDNGALSRIAGRGTPVPGYSVPATIGQVSAPVVSQTGKVAFIASVFEVGGSTQGVGVFQHTSVGVQRLAATGAATPGVPGGVFTEFAVGPSTSSNGTLAFFGSYTQQGVSKFAIWATSPTNPLTPSPVVFPTDQLSNAPVGSTVQSWNSVSVNDGGSVAFVAKLRTQGEITLANDSGIWVKRNGEYANVIREGIPLNILPAGYRPGISSIDTYTALNNRDQLAFTCRILPPGSTLEGPQALFTWDPAAGLSMLAYVGGQFEVSPGQFRTVTQIFLANEFQSGTDYVLPGGAGGGARALNHDGLLTFGLAYTGGYGVFTTRIPSPAGAGLLMMFGLSSMRRRRAAASA